MILYMLTILLTFFDGIGSISKISKENTLKKEAEEAFINKDYKTAIAKFQYLTDTLKVADDKAILNLGHAYYKLNDLPGASKTYEKLYTSTDNAIKSVAAQQLGIISYKADNDKAKALTYFKEALRANPANAEARYNYELLKKMPEKKDDPKMDNKDQNQQNKDKQDQQQNDKNQQNKEGGDKNQQDQKNKDGKGDKDQKNKSQDQKGDKGNNGEKGNDKKNGKGDKQDQQNKEGEKKDDKNGTDKEGGDKDKKEDVKGNRDKQGEQGEGKDDKKQGQEDAEGQALKEKQGGKKGKDKIVANPEMLAKMGMTEQRAKTLLNAMKSSEVQYIQQVKREKPAKKQKNGKPDW